MKRRVIVVAALLAATAGTAQVPIASERRRLVEARTASAAAARRAASLAGAAARETRAADRARADEAAVAARVAAAAADLRTAQARVALVDALLEQQRRRLATGQAPARRLLGALVAMARRPAVAALTQPGSLADQVHVRAVLGATLPMVSARTAGLRAELARTRQLQNAAAVAATALHDGRARLAQERDALAALEAQHRARATDLGRSAIGEQDRALALGERARDLVDRLEEAGRADTTATDLAALTGPMPRPLAPGATLPPAPQGVYRLPVAGHLVTGFGEVSAAGVRSRGLSFAVAPGALVVAPASGTVRYARPFRGFGTIVILDHGGGWSTLLTGLGAAQVRSGDHVAAGEPIGTASAGEEATITVELRRGGDPIDAAALVG